MIVKKLHLTQVQAGLKHNFLQLMTGIQEHAP